MGNLAIALVLAVSLTVLRFPNAQSQDFTSEAHEVEHPFTSAIASWDVNTPGGSWIEIQLRARIGSRWTNWYEMGHWSQDEGRGHRHSVQSKSDADGRVDTDTLYLKTAADAWQARVYFHPGAHGEMPVLTLFAVTTGDDTATAQSVSTKSAWGVDIDVPERTQRIDESPDALGGGGDAWCSPTSVSMIMAYCQARPAHTIQCIKAAGIGLSTWPSHLNMGSQAGSSGSRGCPNSNATLRWAFRSSQAFGSRRAS
jgi:hypothetical protein